MKRFFALFLTSTLLLVLFTNYVNAAEDVYSSIQSQAHMKAIQQDTNEIVEFLNDQGYSVLDMLYKGKQVFETRKDIETDPNRIEKLNNLINNFNKIISLNINRNTESTQNVILPMGIPHPVYSPAIEAVIAYFVSQDYILAAELLSVAYDNDSVYNTYEPVCTDHLYNTITYNRIKMNVNSNIYSGNTSGSGWDNFEKYGGVKDNDWYYAIHGCNYTWNVNQSYRLNITDRYDYEKNEDYEGLAGTAVNLMADAQAYGTIVPYYISINALT